MQLLKHGAGAPKGWVLTLGAIAGTIDNIHTRRSVEPSEKLELPKQTVQDAQGHHDRFAFRE